MKRFLLSVFTLVLALELAAGPAPSVASTINRDTTGPYTLVLGDSLTYRAMNELHGLRPNWVIDGLSRRLPDTIPALISDWVKRRGREPHQIVVALGTNYSGSIWQPWNYRKVRAMLPDTKIVFVTVYRAPDAPDPEATYRTGRFSDGMREAASSQRDVCVAEWRPLVEADPSMLFDGVHATPAAEKTWARLVSNTMREC